MTEVRLGGDVVTDANADFMQQAGRSEQMVNMVINARALRLGLV